MKRDLNADLAICAAATEGPWEWRSGNAKYRDLGAIVSVTDGRVCDFGNCAQYYPTEGNEPDDTDITFMTEAREGWPESIRRAIAAEAKWDALKTRIYADNEELKTSTLALYELGRLICLIERLETEGVKADE